MNQRRFIKAANTLSTLVIAAVLATSASANAQESAQEPSQQQPSQQQKVAIKIEGPAQKKQLEFLGTPRLHQVYEQAQISQTEIFWPGVRLVSANKQNQIMQQQRELTQQLYQLQALFRDNNEHNYAQLAGRIAAQVASWPLVGAEPIGRGHVEEGPKSITFGVDINKKSALTSSYDEARLFLNANPALTADRYQLLLPSIKQHQFEHLQIIGAVWVPFAMTYHPDFTARETAVAEKLKQRFEAITLQEKVVQITAAGDVQTLYIDPHNAYQQEFSAGAKVVALFDTSKLPSRYKHINEQMIELARYWNPMQPQISQQEHFTTLSQYIKDKQEPPMLWLGELHKRQQPSTNDFGSWGLLQMPSGRHADVGEFAFTYFDSEEYRRWAINLQVFPWLEATLRYNDIRTRRYSPYESFSGDQTYKDRGVDFKFRLTEESRWVPETSVGIRDLAGTGLFAGEYVAASKRFGNFDFTAGIGWGYLGKNGNINNPFCELADEFCRRESGFSGRGGSFEVDKWFKGNAAWFGGLEYQTPWDPLTVKVEYDSNNYMREPSTVPMPQDSRWNYGLEYDLGRNMSLKFSYERGNTLMFGFTIRTNFDQMTQPKLDTPPRELQPTKVASIEELKQQEQLNELRSAISEEASTWVGEIALNEEQKTLTLYGNQARYRDSEIALERLGRVLASETPENIETYQFVTVSGNTKLAQDNIDAEIFKDAIARRTINATTQQAYSRSEVTEAPGETLYGSEFEFAEMPTVSVKPYIDQSFGGPEAFYMYQVGLDVRAFYSLSRNTFAYTTVSGRILDNYDKFNFLGGQEEGPLPRVRTYVREYVTSSDIYLRNLAIGHQEQLSKDLFAFGYVGYQEEMFGGFGGELLYRELDSNWAVGVDVNYARQRDWENHFGFRDYDVITGHVTGYWRPSFMPNTLLRVAAGQFLAGDRGVQVAFEHKFKSGIIAGAYAAKTNVSAEEYGEGSFTKGFYISIPFDLIQLRHSAGRGSIGWSPITRDGGQMLGRGFSLFGATDKRSPYYVD
ncbi:YjbH domain-containing protein [Pseudidiomarina gelatinasegens]|uniref:YjbH domain-containing protein n=1 Tax=Pseudidiomarina gelatinasegens TaxID=2487740 RepID=UPI0030EBCB96